MVDLDKLVRLAAPYIVLWLCVAVPAVFLFVLPLRIAGLIPADPTPTFDIVFLGATTAPVLWMRLRHLRRLRRSEMHPGAAPKF